MKEKCLYVSCSNAISQRNSVTTAPHNISLLSDPLRVGKDCKVKRKPVCPLLKLRHGVCSYLGQEAILLIIRYSVLRQDHNLFQSEFSRVRSSVSYFNFQCVFISLRSCSGCLSLLPRLPYPSTFPSLFPTIIYFLRHFLHKM